MRRRAPSGHCLRAGRWAAESAAIPSARPGSAALSLRDRHASSIPSCSAALGKMAAEKQVPGGGSGGGGGGGGGGSGGGRGAGGEENKENERPSAGSKANQEFGDSLSLESILD